MKSINASHKKLISRRGFLKGLFAGAAIVAAPKVLVPTEPEISFLDLNTTLGLQPGDVFSINGVVDGEGHLQNFRIVHIDGASVAIQPA